MNVKFDSDGLSCLLGSEYDRIYSTLKRTLGPAADIFAERKVGNGYLQWALQGNNWRPISECDPSLENAVYGKLSEVKSQIAQRFGPNVEMAQRVLSTPDDSFVYYSEDASGDIKICLVAWGYQYPERVTTSETNVVSSPKGPTEKVTITFIRDGKQLPNFPFLLNGHQRTTSANGVFFVGHVKVGQRFEIKSEGISREYDVNQGDGDIKIYLQSNQVPQSPDLPRKEANPFDDNTARFNNERTRYDNNNPSNGYDNTRDNVKQDKNESGNRESDNRSDRASVAGDSAGPLGVRSRLPMACIVLLLIITYIAGLYIL